MRRPFKYPVSLTDVPTVHNIPVGARLILCAIQDDQPVLWFQVDDEAAKVERAFMVVPTGGVVPDEGIHVASCQQAFPFADGIEKYLVWHVYEVVR